MIKHLMLFLATFGALASSIFIVSIKANLLFLLIPAFLLTECIIGALLIKDTRQANKDQVLINLLEDLKNYKESAARINHSIESLWMMISLIKTRINVEISDEYVNNFLSEEKKEDLKILHRIANNQIQNTIVEETSNDNNLNTH